MTSPERSSIASSHNGRESYHDQKRASEDEDERVTFLEHQQPQPPQSLWRSVIEYNSHVFRPKTRGALLCRGVFAAIILSALASLAYTSTRGLSHSSNPQTQHTASSDTNPALNTMDQAIRALWRHTIPAYDADFETLDGTKFTIDSPQWTTPLGKDLCIINTDTRGMNGTDQPWASDTTTFDWRQVSGWSGAGYLNQYLYSRIHNYRYIYMQTAAPEGYIGAWGRPGAWRHLLPDCRVIVYADSDVIYANLHLPFEWLLNHWNIPSTTSSISMALEPKKVGGWDLEDKFGNHSQNPGFTVIHNAPGETKINTMLSRWANCLTEQDYPGCAKLKSDWPAEMGGFNNYIRYDFPEMVHVIPCTEALGWPEWDIECKGLFMRHYTLRKDLVKPGIEEALARPLMTALQLDMVAHKAELFDDETDKMWVGLAKEGGGKKDGEKGAVKEDGEKGAGKGDAEQEGP